jgi:hypothetical protein
MSELRDNIYEAIMANDQSCNCCGPTEVDASTDAVFAVVQTEITRLNAVIEELQKAASRAVDYISDDGTGE